MGKLKPCDGCMRAKAKAKKLKKSTEIHAKEPGECLFLDATGPFQPSLSSSKLDAKIVDDYSRKTWMAHIKTKMQVTDLLKQHLDELKGQGKNVKFLRCDNAPEHGTKLTTICKERGVTVEFTAPYTPQQNGVVERKIVMDCNQALAMLFGARLTESAQALLHAEAKATATKLSNLLWNKQVKGIPNVLFSGDSRKLKPEHLVQFGQIGHVQVKQQVNTKWVEKLVKCIMVGYADDHSGDTYQMYDPTTGQVRLTRDVSWAAWKRTDPAETLKIFKKDEMTKENMPVGAADDDKPNVPITMTTDDKEPHLIPALIDEVGRNELTPMLETGRTVRFADGPAVTNTTMATTSNIRKPRLMRELKNLQPDDQLAANPPTQPNNTVELHVETPNLQVIPNLKEEVVLLTFDHGPEQLCFTTELSSDPGELKSLREALEGPDSKRWKVTIANEIMNFLKQDAWKKVPLSQVIAEGHRPVPTTHTQDNNNNNLLLIVLSLILNTKYHCWGYKRLTLWI